MAEPLPCTECGAPTNQPVATVPALCPRCYSRSVLGEPFTVPMTNGPCVVTPQAFGEPFTVPMTSGPCVVTPQTFDEPFTVPTTSGQPPVDMQQQLPEDGLAPYFPPPDPR